MSVEMFSRETFALHVPEEGDHIATLQCLCVFQRCMHINFSFDLFYLSSINWMCVCCCNGGFFSKSSKQGLFLESDRVFNCISHDSMVSFSSNISQPNTIEDGIVPYLVVE